MKKENIILEAKQVKDYIMKYKKIPTANTYADGTILSIYTTSYLFASYIRNNKSKEYRYADVIVYNQEKLTDTVNEKVFKEDYLQMINNFIKYCKENHRVPTYITTQKTKTKVSFELFTFCLAKIIVFLAENNTYPNYCLFNKEDLKYIGSSNENNTKNDNKYNCTNPYKSLPINTNKGCDAMGQNTSYYCGVAALQKVLYKFGIKVGQAELARAAGTTTAGTSHNGIRTAVEYVARKFGVKLEVKEYNFSDLGFEKLGKLICKANVDAIIHLEYRNKYGHYEKIRSIDIKNQKLEIVNSLGNKCTSSCYCGYIENRTFNMEKQYIEGISQKSIILITKK